MSAFDPATLAQVKAMQPTRSTWLSANAGSGKTRVLTNRVALLLLGGTKPQNIVCLTYTKAAATEMQNRLFERLGSWAMLPNDKLARQLEELGVEQSLDQEKLDSARTLFALAIETPGGLRIQTIHSFCASILRRFPLEAGISPMFRELDEASKKDLQKEVLREMAEGRARPILDQISRITSGTDYDTLLDAVSDFRDRFEISTTPAVVRSWYGLSENSNVEYVIRELASQSNIVRLKELAAELAALGMPNAIKTAAGLGLALPQLEDGKVSKGLFSVFLTNDRTPRARLVPVALANKAPHLSEFATEFSGKLTDLWKLMDLELAAENTWTLHQFAREFLKRYDETKLKHGWLDFDDQISRTEQLLTNRAVCDWVMFRLDGGIDHILVDESQDTSPAQWRIIRLLAQDFGREEQGEDSRTIFVVGDKKQSIYSFQGADPDGFDHSRDHFQAQLSAVGKELQDLTLRHSFRSAPAILDVVDRVFADTVGAGFTREPHVSFHANMPGRVEIWHPLEKSEKSQRLPWYDLSDPEPVQDADRVLAQYIAERIFQMLKESRLKTSNNEVRPVEPGDILVLVQRRRDLFHHIIRACKSLGLPIAGADRLRIKDELAVKDLKALLSFLALPQDSLSLAAVLRSPLFGWSEADLFQLAHYRRTQHLWDSLQINKEHYPETYPILKDLRDKADFDAPYELLDRILTHWGGRLKLISRLGPEAHEGIDEFLNLVRKYEAQNPASLTGLLAWLEKDESDIKRQAESAGTRIRVMTTHGAKGLEAPIVILPETHTPQKNNSIQVVTDPNGNPIWRQNKEHAPQVQLDGASLTDQKSAEERLRLLYVAMTRAESWLILCGAGEALEKPGTWYQRTLGALEALPCMPIKTKFGEGLRYETGDWPEDQVRSDPEMSDVSNALPDWALHEESKPKRAPKLLKPSEMPGSKTVVGQDENAHALEKGRAVHLLLEQIEWFETDVPIQSAHEVLDRHGISLPEDQMDDAVFQAQAVLSDPSLSWLFAEDVLCEIAVTAPIHFEAHEQMYGIIDRLILEPDRVTIVDFKTNTIVPDHPHETPAGLLQQLAVYAMAIEQIYPDREVDCAILWTAKCEYMPIPHNIVMQALGTPSAS